MIVSVEQDKAAMHCGQEGEVGSGEEDLPGFFLVSHGQICEEEIE